MEWFWIFISLTMMMMVMITDFQVVDVFFKVVVGNANLLHELVQFPLSDLTFLLGCEACRAVAGARPRLGPFASTDPRPTASSRLCDRQTHPSFRHTKQECKRRNQPELARMNNFQNSIAIRAQMTSSSLVCKKYTSTKKSNLGNSKFKVCAFILIFL